MSNHPNRSKKSRAGSRAATPTPAQVREAREAAGHTQAEAAELIYSTRISWSQWESDDPKLGRGMHPAFFELYRLKAGLVDLTAARVEPAIHD